MVFFLFLKIIFLSFFVQEVAAGFDGSNFFFVSQTSLSVLGNTMGKFVWMDPSNIFQSSPSTTIHSSYYFAEGAFFFYVFGLTSRYISTFFMSFK